MADKLTEKQKRWIDYYIATGNATEAARMAGYKGSNHNDIGKQNSAKLRKYINERAAPAENARIATANEVLEFLTAVVRGEITEEVFVPFDGKQIKGASIRDRTDAAKHLAKVHGLDAIAKERLKIDKDKLEIDRRKLETSEQDKVIQIVSNIPRPREDDDETGLD